MIYFLAILLSIFLIYLITSILNTASKVEKEINTILESRLKYTEREYQRNQEQILDLKFKEWLSDNEFDIRRTAIQKMNSHILDNISNELSIMKNNFAFNPKDIKFTGRFIDLIIFDGAANEEIVNIYFIDIQRQGIMRKNNFKTKVASAINNGNLSFQEINL
jgi:predicted Holliday junction resolvase-like endonuclease